VVTNACAQVYCHAHKRRETGGPIKALNLHLQHLLGTPFASASSAKIAKFQPIINQLEGLIPA